MENSKLVMTPELIRLHNKLEYFAKRRDTAVLGVEVRFYEKLMTPVYEEIENLTIQQIAT